MRHLEKLSRKRLGEILVAEGLVSKSQLADAEREQRRTGSSLGATLVEANYLSDWDLAKAVSTQYQLPYIQISALGRNSDVAVQIPPGEMQARGIVPIDRIGDVITLAVAEMPDLDFLRRIEEETGATPFLLVARRGEILAAFEDVLPVKGTRPAEPAPVKTKNGEGIEDLEYVSDLLKDQDDEEGPEGFDISGEAGWQNLFDSADEEVMKEIDT